MRSAVRICPAAPQKNLETAMVSRFFLFLGSTSIVGVAKKNKYQVVSSGNSRHDFYAWENKILFLKLRKFRIPKQTRFKTLVLLLQPSMKPFDHGTSMELRISSDQLR